MSTARPHAIPDERPAAMLEIRLLGGFAVLADGQAIPERAWGGSRKARALVKLLALAPGQRLHRDQVLDALWPDLDPDTAGRTFYQALYLVRRAFASLGVEVTLQAHVLALHAPGGLTTDLAAFEAATTVARRTRSHADYEAALARYGGELLPDDRYEEWAVQVREAARTGYLSLLRDLARLCEERQDWEGARAALDRLVAAEPADEPAHVALMRLYARSGRRAQALQQFGQLRAILLREIDAEPEPASQQLYAAILAGRTTEAKPRTGTGPQSAGASDAGQPRHNLPAPTTALIGRDETIAAIRQALDTARLVTLVGTGGIGKTRLALAVGHTLLTDYPGGTWLLDLAAQRDGALLVGILAQTIGTRERADQPLLETIAAALHDRTTLLILDNCEHLIDACADLAAALLARCPALRILATSRAALRVAGELTWRVPTLPLPAPVAASPTALDLAALRANPAIGLFVERARFARPDFTLDAENSGAVATICRRLDGIPLALELAAVRVAVLTPQQLATRLDDALRVLTGGPRTAPSRQQTLRAALDWSHTLLTADEQALLARLAIFAGGWTLAAAEAMGGGASTDALDTLAALVDKSLVQVEQGGGATELRYRLLEPIRQYAAERLATLGPTTPLQERHAAYFLARAEEAEPLLYGPQQDHWFNALAHDHENCRAALRHDTATGDWLAYTRLVVALHRFWAIRGYHAEGRSWLAPALLAATDAPADSPLHALRPAVLLAIGNLSWPIGDLATAEARFREVLTLGERAITLPISARANLGLGIVESFRGDHAAARASFEAGLPVARQLDDSWLHTVLLNNLGLVVMWQGDAAAARAYQEENLALCRALADPLGIASALANLCEAAHHQGDDQAVLGYAAEALLHFTALGEQRGMAVAENNLSIAHRHLGDPAAARRHAEAALALYTNVQFPIGIALSLQILGEAAQAGGDRAAARRHYRDSLLRRRELGNRRDIALILERLATLAAEDNDHHRAIGLLFAADSLRQAEGLVRLPRDQASQDQALTAAHTALGHDAFAAARAEGTAWSTDEAITQALAYLAA